MDITIENGLPTSLSDIEFEIRNQSLQNIVVDTVFDFVAAGGSETRSINIAGKSVESFLEAIVTNFTVDASAGPVLIDTSDAITVTVTTRDLKVFSAKAIFPAQNIIEVGDTNQLTGIGNARITRAIAKSGFVNVEVESTIEDHPLFRILYTRRFEGWQVVYSERNHCSGTCGRVNQQNISIRCVGL